MIILAVCGAVILITGNNIYKITSRICSTIYEVVWSEKFQSAMVTFKGVATHII